MRNYLTIIEQNLNERSLEDVGIVANRLYVSIRSDKLDDRFSDGIVSGVQGVSGKRTIWADFSPTIGNDIFVIMKADEAIRLNDLKRVPYDNIEKLLANNSRVFARLLNTTLEGRAPADNVTHTVIARLPIGKYYGLAGASSNIVQNLKYDRGGVEGFEELILNTVDDYRRLFLAAAKKVKDDEAIRYLSMKSSANAAIEKSILKVAMQYSDEKEWTVSGDLRIPPSSKLVVAIHERYLNPPEERGWMWNKYDDEAVDKAKALVAMLDASPFDYKIVDSAKTQNVLSKVNFK